MSLWINRRIRRAWRHGYRSQFWWLYEDWRRRYDTPAAAEDML